MIRHDNWRDQLRYIQATVKGAKRSNTHIAPGVVSVRGLAKLGSGLSDLDFNEDRAVNGARVHLCEMLGGLTGVDNDTLFLSAEIKKDDILLCLNLDSQSVADIRWSLFEIIAWIPKQIFEDCSDTEDPNFEDAVSELEGYAVGLENLASKLRNLTKRPS